MSQAKILKEIKKDYLLSLPNRLVKIQELLRDLSTEKLHDLEVEFHKLKGSGRTYGHPFISEIAQMAELSLKHHKKQSIKVAHLSLTLLNLYLQNLKEARMEPSWYEENPNYLELVKLIEAEQNG